MITKLVSIYILGVIGGAAIALTPELLTAIGAITVAVITAVGAVIVNVFVAKNVAKLKELAQENKELTQQNNELTQENLSETKVVQGHVNSAAAASEAKIEGLRKELLLLQNVAADKDKVAALLAQSAAVAPTPPLK